MRIVYLHQYFVTPAMYGGSRSFEMARRLAAAGHDVQMITSDLHAQPGSPPWRASMEDGISVHWANVPYRNDMTFAKRVGAFIWFAVKASRKALSFDCDVVFATSTPLTIAIPARVVSFLRRTPFVFEVRDQWPEVPIALGAIRGAIPIALARWLERSTYRRATHIVALAPGMKEDIVAKGVPVAKVTVIPNGCDNELLARADGEVSPRKTCPWLGGRRLVLFAGTFGAANGVDYLCRLADRVRLRDPEIRFVVIGKGGQRETIRAEAERLGVLDRTFFMIDALPKRQLVNWLHAAQLHVALFRGPRIVWKDAVQNKFFDALAVGGATASNFDGWQTQIAREAGIGLMLDPENLDRAADDLVRAITDDAWLAAVPERARALALGRFDRDRLARELEAVLRAAASPARAGRPA
jgi:glycosyltransferase involved in cell wall biosynthesis